jgi:hypothetical protein
VNTTNGEPTPDRANRIRGWIRTLCDLPERCAGTASERQAAEQVSMWMHELGVRNVAVRPFAALPRAGFMLALHTAVGAVGCLWGGWPGSALAILAAWSFREELRQHQPFLSSLLPCSDSANVIGRVGPEAPARRVVLSAHIDAAQAGWIFAADAANFFARLSQTLRRRAGAPAGPHAMNEALLFAAVLIALGSWLGAHGVLFGLGRVAVTIGLLVACAAGLQWAASPATPGANDNASAVAAMLVCAEQVLPTLPDDVELVLLGTGAEEVGCRGMHAFLEDHLDWPLEGTYFVNFECVGGGALHFIRTEGVLGKVTYPPMLIELARRVAASGTFGAVTATDLLAGTDGHVPAERGYPALSLISLEPNGVPRNYHRLDDTVEGIDAATVLRAADFGAAVCTAALRGQAGPISTA